MASYNAQSGYYELELTAPSVGGIYTADINFTDIFGNEYTDTLDIQVLTKEKPKLDFEKNFMWIFDYKDFSVKDIVEIADYEINIDEETNENSIIRVLKKTTARARDIIAVKKNNDVVYWGIVQEISNEDGRQLYEFSTKYITNMFNMTTQLLNEDFIKTAGVEDFIVDAIAKNFITNIDEFLNLNYLRIEAKTHTKKNTRVTNVENNIYNLHTWMTNCTQNYNIVYNFSVENGNLMLTVENKSYKKELIDTTAQNISSYSEIFETDVVSKVIVLTDTNTYTLYLLNDRTTTTDMNNKNRADGRVETVYLQDNSLEVNSCGLLVDELVQLVNEDGKIKDTYENRVKEIIHELNRVLEIEIVENNNQIENYQQSLMTIENAIVQKEEEIQKEAKQKALDVMKANSYNHNITFSLLNKYMKIGTPIAIKTKESLIYDTYISSIKLNNSKIIEYQCGNIRTKFIEKLLKERKK